ncbi:MAG: type VI secretion system baseplate subunit TssF, partial [Geobacteraceae bacterium]|nr:type VI secretion system baseplate subunit TssF [Geobacteraceae bacterium]
MPPASGIKTLLDELLERGHEFSFVQVMRLARRYLDPARRSRHTRHPLAGAGPHTPRTVPGVPGDPEARLGLNTWCFSGDSLGEVSAVFRMAAVPGIRTPRKSGRAPRQSRTFIDHYREERAALDKLAARYVEEHPNLAPMMSGPLADQGVERLFEGTAFLNALLRQKLEDDIPEF